MVEVEAAGEPSSGGMATEPVADGCDTCPRSASQDSSFGYCEGCQGRLRWCPSCGEFRPQTDWGFGLAGFPFSMVRWVCAACRFRSSDRAADHPRFAVELGLEDRERLQVEWQLDRVATANQHHRASEILRRMSRSVGQTGSVDVDVADFDAGDRRALLPALAQVRDGLPPTFYAPAHAVYRGWAELVADSEPPLPELPPLPSVAERCASIERPA